MVSLRVIISSNDSKTETTDDAIHERQPYKVSMDGYQTPPPITAKTSEVISVRNGGGAQNIKKN